MTRWTITNEQAKLTHAGSVFDFMNASNNFRLIEDSSGRTFDDPNAEVYTQYFHIQSTGASALAGEVQQLNRFGALARSTWDGNSEHNVLLEQRATHDAETVVSAVGDIRVEPLNGNLYSFNNSRGHARYTVQITRSPLQTQSSCSIIANALSSLGDTVGYTTGAQAHTAGDIPARIVRLQIATDGPTYTGDLSQFWISFRTNRDGGDASLFQTTWDLGTGARGYQNNTSDGSSACAKAACAAIWTPGASSTSMLSRVTTDVLSAVGDANAKYQRGTHALFLRARSTGDRAFSIQVFNKVGLGSTLGAVAPRQAVSGSLFKLYPTGAFSVPSKPGNITYMDQTCKQSGLEVRAQDQSGTTGNLEMDCFLLMPRDEGLLYFDTGDTPAPSASGGGILATSEHSKRQHALLKRRLEVFGGPLSYTDSVTMSGVMVLPLGLSQDGEGRLFIAFQDRDTHRLNDEVSISLVWSARWAHIGRD